MEKEKLSPAWRAMNTLTGAIEAWLNDLGKFLKSNTRNHEKFFFCYRDKALATKEEMLEESTQYVADLLTIAEIEGQWIMYLKALFPLVLLHFCFILWEKGKLYAF